MNAGFSSLSVLKAQLLNVDLRSSTDFDAQILAIGLGMAGIIEGTLNRKLARVAGDTHIVRGGRKMILLPRYPVESIASIETRVTSTDSWDAQTDAIDWFSPESGLVNLAIVMGNPRWQVRTTYTGGFFWETLEPTDNGYPTTKPGAATALPDSIFHAWVLQCQEVWRRADALGLSAAMVKAELRPPALTGLDLLPVVNDMLRDHVRYNLT